MSNHYIESRAQLTPWIARIQEADVIGIDTEFKRRDTYYATLCLLQLQLREHTLLIDPLAEIPSDRLRQLLLDTSATLIIHSGRQDLEILFVEGDPIAERLFDTQLAAALVGYGGNIGYARLVQTLLGLALAKAETLTDWTRRPLSARQRHYAAEDVWHLPPLYQQLKAQLQARDRLEILQQEQRRLYNDQTLFGLPAQPWTKIHNIRKLRGARLAIAQHLAAWREREARDRNLPKSQVLNDQQLFALAQKAPDRLAAVQQCLGKPQGQARAESLLALVEEGRWLTPVAPSRPPKGAKACRYNKTELRSALEAYTEQSGIDMTLLTPKGELDRYLNGDPEALLRQGWRRAAMCEALALLPSQAAK